MLILVSFLDIMNNRNIDNFIKNVGNSETNIAKLLEWKFKKEK